MRHKSLHKTAILASLLIAPFFLGYPNYVIRPWRQQGAQELQAALFVLQYQRLAGLLCAAVASVALALYFRTRPPRLGIAIASAGTLLVLVSAALSRVNIYERMFHPAGSPSFESGGQTKLEGDEKILAVAMNNEARAYPVRSLSYHHIVNDVIGGVPIAATY
jgi:hypothetical protein